jgi:PKD repeat protein
MKITLIVGALCALTSPAISQIVLPPHASTYNGFTRGFSFTSKTVFFINKLDLPPNAKQTGDTASYLVNVNGTTVLRSVGNAGAFTVAPPLSIKKTDVVTILGNWSPATTSNFTAHNSYGAGGGTYSTNIEGVPHVLFRAGWQYDIGDPAYATTTMFNGLNGSIGRVLVYTTPPAGLFAGFTATPTTGPPNTSVKFTDTSFSSAPGGVTSWTWDFGDGSPTSNVQHPSHVYKCGTFTPKLTVTDATHSPSTKSYPGLISVGTVVADFKESGTFGSSPYSVTFTDTSTGGPTAWEWDFGDGSAKSSLQNPVHVYTKGGKFTVSLKATGQCNTDTKTKTGLIEVCVPGGNSGSISTIFTGGNGLTGANCGNMFKVTVINPDGIKITSVDINSRLAATTATGCDVWITPKDHVGNNTAGLWVKVATGTGVSAGGLTATNIDVTDFYLAPGAYGMWVSVHTGGIHYTTGNGPNQIYQNCDLRINAGWGICAIGGGFNNPRVWNGGLHYAKNDIAGNGGYGYGCAGSNSAIPHLSMSAEPKLGGSGNFTVTGTPSIPAAPGFLFVGSTKQIIDLTVIGMPGCFLHTDTPISLGIVSLNGTATLPFTVPNSAPLVGVQVLLQAAVSDAPANVLGASASNGLSLRIGN